MGYGPVNVPGARHQDMTQAIEGLKAELFSGELTLPLLTADGEAISTVGGADILAVKKMTGLSDGDVSTAVSKAVAGLSAQVYSAENRARQYTDRITANMMEAV